MKWLKLLPAAVALLARLRDRRTWREPSTWAALAALLASAALLFFVGEYETFATQIAAIASAVAGLAGILLPEQPNLPPIELTGRSESCADRTGQPDGAGSVSIRQRATDPNPTPPGFGDQQ
ncbi:MAG: hypothetical protein ABTR07_14910 [Candidatus Competibacter denitrificans]